MKIILAIAVSALTFVNSIDGRAQLAPEKKTFFNYQSKVGLVLIVDSIQYIKTKHTPVGMSFGIIPVTVSSKKKKPSSKYSHALKTVAAKVDPTQAIKDLYLNMYPLKQKTISLLEISIDSGATKFKGVKVEGKQYYKNDVRSLKDKLQIPEILVVHVQYGLISGYSLGIELYRNCFAIIETQLINLRNNQIIFKENTDRAINVNAWNTPPNYDNLKNTISKAIEDAIERERKKYEW